MKDEDKMEENKELIEKGDREYFEFVRKIGLDVGLVMTPTTKNLQKLGEQSFGSQEFIILALDELHDNFWTTSINVERR